VKDQTGKRFVILSVDYEIFGNGTGDVRQHVTEPAERMARLCEQHHVPLTVFFEIEEYLAFERHARELHRVLGYDPAALIREQIISFAKRGHDIQLHIHPEWYQAEFKDGHWHLSPDKHAVDDLFETQEETTRFIAERQAVIEEMLGNSPCRKRVRVYRAGAFSAQPSGKLLAALAENGFLIDSSVVKGLQRSWNGGGLDYRNVPCAKGPWRIKKDVAAEDPSGALWEFPIYSIPGRRYHQLTLNRLRAKFSRNVPRGQQQAMVNQLGLQRPGPLKLLKFLCQPVPIKLDFHNLSPGKLLTWIRSAPSPQNGNPDAVVLIGHTKEHIDDKAFERLLKLTATDSSLRIVSFNDVASMIQPVSKA
jgi:hypothetical protein